MEKPNRFVDRVFIHCSASDAPRLVSTELRDAVYRWHVTERGWDDIGYHFLIDKEGNRMRGRSLELKPAAQAGHNKGSIAIMVHGDKSFEDVQFGALTALCNRINREFGGRITFHGHCEVSPKTCPNFDYTEILGLDGFGRIPFIA